MAAARSGSLGDLRDLRSLDPDAGHQPLLAEDEGVDIARERVRRHRLGDAGIDDDDARPHAELETTGRIELLQRLIVHEEERVAEGLDARLEPVRRRNRVVVADRPALLPEHALADLSSDHEAALHDR